MNNNTKIEAERTHRFKIDMRNFTNFDPNTQKSKKFNWRFNWLLVTKVQRNYLSWHRRVMQILKKNWLVVWKMTWEIWQIFTRALESVKIGTLMGSLKFTEELCVMTMKNNAKFEEELTCHFKTDMRNLTNFDSST